MVYLIFGLKKSSALKICSKHKSALSLASPALGRELDLKDRREVRRSWKKKKGLSDFGDQNACYLGRIWILQTSDEIFLKDLINNQGRTLRNSMRTGR